MGSLRRESLGDCHATYSLESSAVSVSLSPTSRHLLVGLTSRTSRIISLSPADRQLMAQVFRIKLPSGARERGRLIHRRDINQMDSSGWPGHSLRHQHRTSQDPQMSLPAASYL